MMNVLLKHVKAFILRQLFRETQTQIKVSSKRLFILSLYKKTNFM